VFLLCCLMASMSYPWGMMALLLKNYSIAILFYNYKNLLIIYLLYLLLFGPVSRAGGPVVPAPGPGGGTAGPGPATGLSGAGPKPGGRDGRSCGWPARRPCSRA